MTLGLARIVMTLAIHCLGDARRAWALAMQGEFETAVEARKPLSFAAGCLVAACRDMPSHEEGRFVLAKHGLALFVLIPIASLELLCAAGAAFPQGSMLYDLPSLSTVQTPYLVECYLAAIPLLLGLWLLLGVLHVRLAWVLLDGDWPQVIAIGSMIGGGAATLMLFSSVLALDDPRTLLQASALAIELTAIMSLARWQGRLSSDQPA